MNLSIIIPAYNEENNLEKIVKKTLLETKKSVKKFEIIIIDDGSKDNTYAVALQMVKKFNEIKVLQHPKNMGSGMAIRTGIIHAKNNLITYIPADGQFELSEIKKYIRAAQNADIVIGSRMERSDYSLFRLLSSWVFIKLVNFLFHSNYKDVNWVHMWKKKVFKNIQVKSKGVFLLEETLVRASKAGFKIVEIDSLYKPRLSGKAKGSHPLTILKTLFEMAGLWLEMNIFKK